MAFLDWKYLGCTKMLTIDTNSLSRRCFAVFCAKMATLNCYPPVSKSGRSMRKFVKFGNEFCEMLQIAWIVTKKLAL